MNKSPWEFTQRLVRCVRAWRKADSGNITVIFALSIIPMVGLVGAAVD